jgi:hypothetical protein
VVGLVIEYLNNLGANQLLGRDMEPVGVAPNGLEQPGSRVAEFSEQCASWGGGFVTSEDLPQNLGWSAGCDGVGSDKGVRVAVADHLEVKVVGRSPAGEHRIQLLPGLLPGDQAVHRVGGEALGAVDRGGIAEAGWAADIVGGQPDCAVTSVVSREVRLADGNQASVGDVIITRSNNRRLCLAPADWVKNGDRWTVTQVGKRGDTEGCQFR